jgi:sugar lactone lactonase YvrE
MKKKYWLLCFFPLVCLAAYVLFWPVKVDPKGWNAPENQGLVGDFSANQKLSTIEYLAKGKIPVPDSVIVHQNQLYASALDGKVYQLSLDGKKMKLFGNTNGRPTGSGFDANGNLIVGNEQLSKLQQISPTGMVQTLTTTSDDGPLHFINDLTVSNDGIIYITDSSSKYRFNQGYEVVLEHAGDGRLISYNPKTKETKTLLKGLFMPNGVMISRDQSYLLITEMNSYQVKKYWLTGSRKGKTEIITNNLPGLPNDISQASDGGYWISITLPRSSIIDLLSSYPYLRKVLARIPKSLRPVPKEMSFVIRIDSAGKVTENLQDANENGFGSISSVSEYNGKLYLGSYSKNQIGRISIPK